MKIARVIGLAGRFLVLAGLLLLFYTAYLLWGTSVYTKNAQRHLADQVKDNPVVKQVTATGEIPPARPATEPRPGDPLWDIVVEKIALRATVVSGVEPSQLSLGPGHFRDSPYPGESGNVPISGHRTTYNAPFYRINELAPGDRIVIESGPVRFNYTVSDPPRIVSPNDTWVVQDRGRDELTLTSCHPRYSASQRIVVWARYDGPELIATSSAPAAAEGPATAGERELVPAPPPPIPADTIALGALSLAALLGALALEKRTRLAAAWASFVLIAGAGLWTQVFPQILRLMPSNY